MLSLLNEWKHLLLLMLIASYSDEELELEEDEVSCHMRELLHQ